MTFWRLSALTFLLVAALAEIAKENGVLVLTDDNFDEAIGMHPNGLLVEMYAPWCGHCKKLAPEYEKAAAHLEEKGFSIAKLDATEHKTAANKYGVRGFPTIKYIGKNVTLDYKGGRTADDIVKFVIKKSGPATVLLESKEAVEKFATDSEVAVVGYFSDPESAASKVFTTAAATMDDFEFGLVSDSAIISSSEVEDNTVVLFKKFDEGKATLEVKDTSVEDLLFFVSLESLPLFMEFSPETSQKIFGGPIQTHAIFFTNEVDDGLNETIQKIAKENKGKLLHVQVKTSEQRVLEYFGIKEEDCPTFLIVNMAEGALKFPLGGKDLSYESVSKHEADYLNGLLTPFLKSEEPTDEDLAGNVKIVKGKNFESLVIKNDKDVFVKFYAPWCGHCKALAPVWEELADAVAEVESIEIVKFDATANEINIKGVDVKGFPTLYFFPGKDKSKPKLFSGGRTFDDLMKYLKKEAAPFEIPEKKEETVEETEDKKDEL